MAPESERDLRLCFLAAHREGVGNLSAISVICRDVSPSQEFHNLRGLICLSALPHSPLRHSSVVRSAAWMRNRTRVGGVPLPLMIA